MWLGVRGNEMVASMKQDELKVFTDETYVFKYYQEISRGPTKNHFSDWKRWQNTI